MIKKSIVFLMTAVILLSFSACESREERERQAAQAEVNRANNAYEDAKRRYDDLSRSIAEIESLQDAINNAG